MSCKSRAVPSVDLDIEYEHPSRTQLVPKRLVTIWSRAHAAWRTHSTLLSRAHLSG